MEDKASKNERALAKEGQLIETLDGLKAGDIIGINHYTVEGNKSEMYQEATIHFVNKIEGEICIKRETIPPAAYFKRPTMGVRFSDSLDITYAYIHVPRDAAICLTQWSPLPENTMIWRDGDSRIAHLRKEPDEKLYLIRRGLLYELGQLIPQVELPSWGFMFQSNNPQETKDICAAVKKELENARDVHSRIEKIFKQYQNRADERITQERI